MQDLLQKRTELQESVRILSEQVKNLQDYKDKLVSKPPVVKPAQVNDMENRVRLLSEQIKDLELYKSKLLSSTYNLDRDTIIKSKKIVKIAGQINDLSETAEKAKTDIDDWKAKEYKETDEELRSRREMIDKKEKEIQEKQVDLRTKELSLVTQQVIVRKMVKDTQQKEENLSREREKIDQTSNILEKDRQEIDQLLEKTRNDSREADNLKKESEKRYKDTTLKCLMLSRGIQKASLESKKTESRLTGMKAELDSRGVYLTEKEENLRKMKIRLQDKEDTLKRTAKRLNVI